MEKVLNQAELLAESILSSKEYINMRLCEQKAMQDEYAVSLIAKYNECRQVIEEILSSEDVNSDELNEAGEALRVAEKEIDENETLIEMRDAGNAFGIMMEQVNRIIKYVVTGEDEQEGCGSSCGGSCGGCSGCN